MLQSHRKLGPQTDGGDQADGEKAEAAKEEKEEEQEDERQDTVDGLGRPPPLEPRVHDNWALLVAGAAPGTGLDGAVGRAAVRL